MSQWNKEQGWEFESSQPYEWKVDGNEKLNHAISLSKESDVIIVGSAPEIYVKERMKGTTGKITLFYSERIYKRGRWRCLSPRGIFQRINTYHRYHNHGLYMLCASAYTSSDLLLQGAYLGKCYKWGYFPETMMYQIEDLMRMKETDKVKLLWCGRLIGWKHPEVVIKLARLLKEQHIEFELNIIGTGELDSFLHNMVKEENLGHEVHLLGAMPSARVREYMECSNIFLSTSDFREGWGAVVNEAMNSGCTVVVSHAVGAAPYLIHDKKNGLIYKNGDLQSLFHKVLLLIRDQELSKELGKNAYHTIISEWNATIAVERLLLLIDDLQRDGTSNRFLSGPCSKAQYIGNHWFKE